MPGAKYCRGDVFVVDGAPGISVIINRVIPLPSLQTFGYDITCFNVPFPVGRKITVQPIPHVAVEERALDVSVVRKIDHREPQEGGPFAASREFVACALKDIIRCVVDTVSRQ
jgi:hypothetical protein